MRRGLGHRFRGQLAKRVLKPTVPQTHRPGAETPGRDVRKRPLYENQVMEAP